jgi:hypothetical protein
VFEIEESQFGAPLRNAIRIEPKGDTSVGRLY